MLHFSGKINPLFFGGGGGLFVFKCDEKVVVLAQIHLIYVKRIQRRFPRNRSPDASLYHARSMSSKGILEFVLVNADCIRQNVPKKYMTDISKT